MQARQTPPFWLWPNILSLDAPFIAVVWQDFLARCYSAPLFPAGRVALGVTVWAIYLADRLLDVRHPAQGTESARHNFYRQHRTFAWLLLCAVLFVDIVVVFHWLRPLVLDYGLGIAAGVAIYLAVFALPAALHVSSAAWKKTAAAVLFASGIFLIVWLGTEHAFRKLAWPALQFAALCLTNLLLIENWELGLTRQTPWVWILFILCACHPRTWSYAIAISGVGLAVLSLQGKRLSRRVSCVLADVALLSPLLFRLR